MKDQLYQFHNAFNDIHSYTYKEALDALKSTTKSSSDAWNLDIPASNVRGSFCNVTMKIFFFGQE